MWICGPWLITHWKLKAELVHHSLVFSEHQAAVATFLLYPPRGEFVLYLHWNQHNCQSYGISSAYC